MARFRARGVPPFIVALAALSLVTGACAPAPSSSPGSSPGASPGADPSTAAEASYPPVDTRSLAGADSAVAATELARAIVDAPDIATAYRGTADALARAGIRIETLTHVYVEPVAPAAASSMWPRQVLSAAIEAQNRRFVDRISATDAATLLAAFGWSEAEINGSSEGWLIFLKAWLSDARANTADPISFAPLFAAEMLRLGDGVDLATAAPSEVRFGLLELIVLSAAFERGDRATASAELMVAHPVDGRGIGPALAEGPCDSTLERYGIPPNTGDITGGEAPAWMQKGAVGLLGLSSQAAKIVVKALKAFQKIWRAAAFYFYSFVRLETSDKRLHKPNEEEADIYATFTAKTGVDPEAFKAWVKDNGGPNGVRELNDDARCAQALGFPLLTDVGDIADDVEKWIIDWEVVSGMPEHAEVAPECGTSPTTTCNRFFRHQPTFGSKLQRTGASVAEADFFIKLKEEKKDVHTPGAVEREVPVTIQAKVDSSSMPSISPGNLTSPSGLIGPGLETIAGLVQSSFKPSSKATIVVTFHDAIRWTTNADTPSGQIRGTKCEGIGGEWTVSGEEHVGPIVLNTLWNITIDATTLSGTYRYEKIQVITEANSIVTANSKGNARIVVNQDGTVMMTVDPAPITLKSTSAGVASATVIIPGDGRTFLWEVDAAAECT